MASKPAPTSAPPKTKTASAAPTTTTSRTPTAKAPAVAKSGGKKETRKSRREESTAVEDGETAEGSFVFEGRGATYDGAYTSIGGVLQRHGPGVFVDGESRYVGTWHEDLMHGEGTFHYPSGAVYKGQWVRGQYEGRGVYQWPDGTVYTGEFSQNAIHGHGRVTSADGREWAGQYYNNTGPGLSRDQLTA